MMEYQYMDKSYRNLALKNWKPFSTAPYRNFKRGNGSPWNDISLIYPVYVNRQEGYEKVLENIKYYTAFSKDILKRLHLIIVDDCSPYEVTLGDDLNLNYILLRIDEDIRWNSGGAKNLAVGCAETSYIILADIDLIFPETTIQACMSAKNISDGTVYVFDMGVLSENGKWEEAEVHPNCFFMTKQSYIALHGYNEDYCGYYGDDLYINQLLHMNREIYNCGERILCTDASGKANSLERRVDPEVYRMLVEKGITPSYQSLRFPWHFVKAGKYC